MRPSGRAPDQLRPISLEPGFSRHAEGSCLVQFGDTHVLCTARVEERVPPWLRNTGRGWVTAEYGMLPRSTHTRTDREAARGKQSGRTQEIQRLIGRSLRAVVDLAGAGRAPDQHRLRRAAGRRRHPHRRDHRRLGGAALRLRAADQGRQARRPTRSPARSPPCRAACGEGTPVLDLDYAEDSKAEADANFVLTGTGGIVEVQGTAEKEPFSEPQFIELHGARQEGRDRADAPAAAGDRPHRRPSLR